MFRIKDYMKVIKTCNLYCAFLTLGLLLSLVGPSLLDLQQLINADTQHISLIFTARATGYIVGAILSGIVFDLVKFRQAVLGGCCLVAGGTMLGIPWSRNFTSLVGYILFNGLFLGGLETGGNVCCLNLWGKDSGPIFQGLHFTYGFGGLISPLIAAPYLGQYITDGWTRNVSAHQPKSYNEYFENLTATIKRFPENIHLTNNFSQYSVVDNFSSDNLPVDQSVPGILYPYSITGSIAFLTTVLFIATSIVSPTEETQNDDTKMDNSKRSRGFMVTVVLLSFLLIFVSCGMEIGYAQMVASYSVKGSLHLTVNQGSYLTSVFWALNAAFRLLSTFISIKIKSLTLIIFDLVLVSAGSLMILLLMPNELVLWIATGVFGAGIASFYASSVGWINTHINVTNKIAAIITVGAALGEMVAPVIISFFMDTLPEMFAYVVATACLLTCLMVLTMYAFFRKFDRKALTKKPEIYVVRTLSI